MHTMCRGLFFYAPESARLPKEIRCDHQFKIASCFIKVSSHDRSIDGHSVFDQSEHGGNRQDQLDCVPERNGWSGDVGDDHGRAGEAVAM